MANVVLKGSERLALREARAVQPADPHERLEASIIVRPRGRAELEARVAALRERPRGAPRALSRAAFARRHGASAADMRAVRAFARAHGLVVVQGLAARRTLIVSGTVAQFNAAFDVQLHYFEHVGGTYRGRTGPIHIPAELDGVIEAVLGLDNRPQAQPRFRVRVGSAAAAVAYTPPQVAALYGFPAATGAGQCVALIELGGGYRPADLQAYFAGLKLGMPQVTAVSVDHARNTPTGSANGPDGEVMLDIEVLGSMAPGARIVVYFAPNTDAGFLDAVTSAIHDTTHRPDIVSISWGGSESTWTAQAMTAMDEAFQAGAAMGVSICIAAGDNGSSDGVDDGANHVDFPASSPHVLACGGTTLRVGSVPGVIGSEVVWNDGASGGATGGGVSSFFAAPAWQAGLAADQDGATVPLTRRGVPDVAADADPDTGYDVRVDGSSLVIGGTSAVAPLWSALIARLNELGGAALGYLNARLYAQPAALRDITRGNNGAYGATAGWDACTGLGSPNGPQLSKLP